MAPLEKLFESQGSISDLIKKMYYASDASCLYGVLFS